MKKKIKILAFRTDRIGDLINSSSILKSLKSYYNNPELHLVCSEYNSSIAMSYDFVDKVHVYNKKLSIIGKLIFYIKLIFNSYDICLVIDGKTISKVVSFLTRSKKKYIICFKKKRSILGVNFTLYRPPLNVCKFFYDAHVICDEDYNNKSANSDFNNHYLSMYYHLFKKDNIHLLPEKHCFNIDKNSLDSFINFFDINIKNDFINIHIDYKWDEYNLDIDRFNQMLFNLSAKKKITITSGFEGSIFFNNLKNHYSLFSFKNDGSFVKNEKKTPNILLIESLSINLLACFIRNCSLSITSHSGAVIHISAAFNIPIIDFIKKSKVNEYDRWVPPNVPYYRAFVDKLENLENEIDKKLTKS